MLQKQLDLVNYEKKELLKTILELTVSKKEIETTPNIDTEALKPKTVPWRIRQQQLEAEDREAARILQSKKKEMEDSKSYEIKVPSISDLEKEVLENA